MLILIVHNYCIFTGPTVVLIFTYQELYCSPGMVHRQELELCWWVGALPMWGRSRMNFNAHTDTILSKIERYNMLCID